MDPSEVCSRRPPCSWPWGGQDILEKAHAGDTTLSELSYSFKGGLRQKEQKMKQKLEEDPTTGHPTTGQPNLGESTRGQPTKGQPSLEDSRSSGRMSGSLFMPAAASRGTSGWCPSKALH
jgi:hypothetical protein